MRTSSTTRWRGKADALAGGNKTRDWEHSQQGQRRKVDVPSSAFHLLFYQLQAIPIPDLEERRDKRMAGGPRIFGLDLAVGSSWDRLGRLGAFVGFFAGERYRDITRAAIRLMAQGPFFHVRLKLGLQHSSMKRMDFLRRSRMISCLSSSMATPRRPLKFWYRVPRCPTSLAILRRTSRDLDLARAVSTAMVRSIPSRRSWALTREEVMAMKLGRACH